MHFDSDYMNICHPLILQRMAETQSESFPGYGTDALCQSAKNRIRHYCQCPEAEIFFLAGGTQTNQVVLDALLRSHEGVLAADTAHIATHESGAIEFTGHKVLPLITTNGKISAQQVDEYVNTYFSDPNWEHIVEPGAVYITHPTEYGTIYTLSELEAISAVCRKHQIPLYLDGARLGYGLTADGADVTLPDIARLCDAFYIGGTKCGAMYGEAVVFPHPSRARRFFSHIKRHGALLAKGWVVGLQFDTLFSPQCDTTTSQCNATTAQRDTASSQCNATTTQCDATTSQCDATAVSQIEDTLYYNICRHAITEAMRIKRALADKGYTIHLDSPTNQQFVNVSLGQAERLNQHLTYGQWEPPCNGRVTIRFATSWATRSEDVDRLIELL